MAATTEKKPGFIQRLTRSVRDMNGEMKRVVWPTKKQTINNTGIVIAFMIAMAIIVGAFDTVLSMLIKFFFGA